MRLLAFCDYFSPDSSGGTERAAWEVYRRLAAKGAVIRVITALPRGFRSYPAAPNLEVRSAPMAELQRWLRVQAAISPALFIQVRRLIAGFRPDVLHANTLFFQTSAAAALIQARTRIPLVTTAQIAGLDLLPGPGRIAARVYERSVGQFILSRSRKVVAVSDSVRHHLDELFVDADRIVVVPNGVDLDRFHPRSAAPSPLSSGQFPSPTGGGQSGGLRILFIGRLIANKGPHLFLQALLDLHRDGVPFAARFLGEGPMRRELEQRAAPLGSAVEFRGQVQDVAAELQGADLVVRPSLTEGLPLAVLEAMASGVCVLASNIAGNRDVIDDGTNGLLVAPNDPSALAMAIRRMITNPGVRQRMASAGHATAQRYSWDRVADAMERVLEQAAGLAPSEVAA